MPQKVPPPLQVYRVSGEVTVSAYLYVQARSPEEALQRAAVGHDTVIAADGHRHTGADPFTTWIVADGDGSPRPTRVEVLDTAETPEDYQ